MMMMTMRMGMMMMIVMMMMMTMRMKTKRMMMMLTKPSSWPLQQLLVSVQRRSVAVVRLSTKVAKVLMRRNRDDQDEDENYDNI